MRCSALIPAVIRIVPLPACRHLSYWRRISNSVPHPPTSPAVPLWVMTASGSSMR
tara:strand:+ start:81695 stop:81859 length:165 start_codon:yes stop_codon:yes gene_type:complete